MWKTLLLVAAGLGAGFAIAVWMQPEYEPPEAEAALPAAAAPATAPRTAADTATTNRLQQLESTLQAEIEQRAALEQRVTELGDELEALRAPRQIRAANGSAGGAPVPDEARLPPAAQEAIRRGRMGPDTAERQLERLVAAGFTPDRAAWIQKRNEEIVLEQMQAQYTARRGGQPVGAVPGEQTLRSELGEQDYERYLTATGRPTRVNVFNVLAGSPGEHAGLHAGDEIVSYAGQRVFDMRDLNDLTLEGTPGETVLIDVIRNGQTVQVAVPRGPIGIGGGGGFRRGP